MCFVLHFNIWLLFRQHSIQYFRYQLCLIRGFLQFLYLLYDTFIIRFNSTVIICGLYDPSLFFMQYSIHFFCFITWFDNKTVIKCGSYDISLCSFVSIQSRIFAFNFAWSSACCNSCNFFRTPSNRYRSRFIEQVGHGTTHASIGNKHLFYIGIM